MDNQLHPPPVPGFSPRFWMLVLIVVLVGAIIFAASKPIYRGVKTRRARALAAQAEKLLEEEHWKEASEKAQAAYQLSPADGSTLRAVAHLYRTLRKEQAFIFWDKLLTTTEATLKDRQEMAELALALGRLDLAEPQIKQLLLSAPEELKSMLLSAEFYSRKGDLQTALHYSRKAIAQKPSDNQSRLLLGRLLLQSPQQRDQAEARNELFGLAEGKDAISLEAVTLSTGLRTLSAADASYLIDRLAHHPLGRLEHHLLALQLQVRQEPQRRPALLAAFVKSSGNIEVQQKLTLARWLNQNNEYALTVELVTPAVALQDANLCLAWLDALDGLKRWQEVHKILTTEKLPLEHWMSELFLARISQESGRTLEGELHWRRVILEVPDQPALLAYVAQYAERSGAISEAAKTYRRLADNPAMAYQAYLGLIRLAERQGNTRTLRDLMKELSELRPADPEPRNDLAYLSLLLNDNAAAAGATARQLFKEDPKILAHRITLALADLRLNDVAGARGLVIGLGIDWRQALPGWQAVRAAVFGACGDNGMARQLARQIPQERLKPEERALIQPWL